MRSFENYINEAKVSQKNLSKMANLFAKYLGKKINQSYYVLPYLTDIRGGYGQEVWLQDWRKFRFNWIQSEIKSITIWDSQTSAYNSYKGDRTVHLNGLNVIQVAKELVDVFKKRSYTGKKEFYPNPIFESSDNSEKGNFLLEAKKKRVSPEEFMPAFSNRYPKVIQNASWEQISDVADANGWQVPGAVRKAPKKGGYGNKSFDLSSFVQIAKAVQNSASTNTQTSIEKLPEIDDTAEPIDAVDMEVDKGDKVSIEIPDLSGLESKFADKIAAFDVDRMSDPDYIKYIYTDLENKVNAVAQGLNRLLVLVGGAGLGKTFTTTSILKKYGWNKASGLTTPGSANELYRVLFMNRNPGDIIVIDDADKVMDDPNAVNVFKQAFTSGGQALVGAPGSQGIRNISKLTPEEQEEFMAAADEKITQGEKYELPHLFEYQGSVIFISNRTKGEFNDAVLSRSQFVDMSFTPKQVWLKIEEILEVMPNDNGKMPDLTGAEKKEVYDVAYLLYYKALQSAMEKWNNTESNKERKRLRLVDPKELKPTLRFIAKGLLYKEIANKTGAGDSWIANLRSSL